MLFGTEDNHFVLLGRSWVTIIPTVLKAAVLHLSASGEQTLVCLLWESPTTCSAISQNILGFRLFQLASFTLISDSNFSDSCSGTHKVSVRSHTPHMSKKNPRKQLILSDKESFTAV